MLLFVIGMFVVVLIVDIVVVLLDIVEIVSIAVVVDIVVVIVVLEIIIVTASSILLALCVECSTDYTNLSHGHQPQSTTTGLRTINHMNIN